MNTEFKLSSFSAFVSCPWGLTPLVLEQDCNLLALFRFHYSLLGRMKVWLATIISTICFILAIASAATSDWLRLKGTDGSIGPFSTCADGMKDCESIDQDDVDSFGDAYGSGIKNKLQAWRAFAAISTILVGVMLILAIVIAKGKTGPIANLVLGGVSALTFLLAWAISLGFKKDFEDKTGLDLELGAGFGLSIICTILAPVAGFLGKTFGPSA